MSPRRNPDSPPTRYLSVCSGIEAASVAWGALGWQPTAFAEIEPYPSAVLAYRFPEVPNLGDLEGYREWPIEKESVDLLVGGTPCQSFSVAGLRKGLDDPRGNLALLLLAALDRFRPRWLVWENVPGVLSHDEGRTFGTIVSRLAECGYGWAYRVLDSVFYGVPQKRRRVFVVGYLGDWRRAAAVLFELASLRGDLAPSAPAREEVARCLRGRANASHLEDSDTYVVSAFNPNAGGSKAFLGYGEKPTAIQGRNPPAIVTHALIAEGHDTSEDGTGRGTPLVVDRQQITHPENRSNPKPGAPCHSLGAEAPLLVEPSVRRLTPRECERLQGLPDDWTRVPWRGKPAEQCPDVPRYKAIGNSMAVPVVRWIGERIEMVDRLGESRGSS